MTCIIQKENIRLDLKMKDFAIDEKERLNILLFLEFVKPSSGNSVSVSVNGPNTLKPDTNLRLQVDWHYYNSYLYLLTDLIL